jgi:hypothetical protein
LPEELNDRQQEICEPLLAIAELAGEQWLEKARGALVKVCCQEEDASTGVKLLTAIRGIFDQRKADKLTTEVILEDLVAIEDGPWAFMFEDALKHDKLRIAAAKLAGKLKGYKNPDNEKIKPRTVKLADGTTAKGYHRREFERAWKLYSTASPISGINVTNVTNVTNEGKKVTTSQKVTTNDVTGANDVTGPSLVKTPKVTTVTTVTTNPDIGHKRANCVADGGPPCTNDGPLCDACEQFREGKTVHPGDWIRLTPEETYPHWLSALRQALAKPCELCGEPLGNEPYLWLHYQTHAVQCPNCRETAWWADGYEIDQYGYPSCWDSQHSREQRIAERDLAMLEKAIREWRESDEGRAELERARLECARLGVRPFRQTAGNGMTPGKFLANAATLFNATPAKDEAVT